MFTCMYCGNIKEDSLKSEEHIIPESCGGKTTTLLVCDPCNKKANQEIDEKFKDQYIVSSLRATAGIIGKNRNGVKKKHIHKSKDITNEGIKVNTKLDDEGVKQKMLPLIVYPTSEEEYGYIKADPSDIENIIKDIENKTKNRKYKIQYPVSEVKSFIPEKVNIEFQLNEDVILREQIKILLGLCCLYIDNFSESNTANHLRDLLWTQKNVAKKLFDGSINMSFFPYFDPEDIKTFNITTDDHLYNSYITDGIEMRVIKRKHIDRYIHKFAYYSVNGKIRVYLNIFNFIHCYLDTIEDSTYFYSNPEEIPNNVELYQKDDHKNKNINEDLSETFQNLPQLVSVLSALDMMNEK